LFLIYLILFQDIVKRVSRCA